MSQTVIKTQNISPSDMAKPSGCGKPMRRRAASSIRDAMLQTTRIPASFIGAPRQVMGVFPKNSSAGLRVCEIDTGHRSFGPRTAKEADTWWQHAWQIAADGYPCNLGEGEA